MVRSKGNRARTAPCDFEVGGRPKVAEPGEGVRGELARAMLYMEERYGVDVRMPREALLEWHENDLPREWERGACATDRSRDRITEPLYRKPIVSIDRGAEAFPSRSLGCRADREDPSEEPECLPTCQRHVEASFVLSILPACALDGLIRS